MENKILKNLVYLAKNLRNLEDVLLHFLQDEIISVDEREEILSKVTSSSRNTTLLLLMTKKDWEEQDRDRFFEILRSTNNEHCADALEQTLSQGTTANRPKIVPKSKILKRKWWPEQKWLIKSLYKRKLRDKFLVEILHDKIQSDENRMVAIFESANASKLTGMGGMGKTLTAKWYAHEYENEYGNILWIDCGEGSLLQSFTKLARDLDLKHRNELLEVEELSRKSYEELEDSKCLLVFDNAESYQGKEGILKVLPKDYKNFYCLITSRYREWGEAGVYGKMTDLQLEVFSEAEGLEFLEKNLNDGIEFTNTQLKELSKLLGHLPLALQLAVSAINNKKINLQTYIEKTSVKDAEKIVNEKFGDYEKKINMNVEISLELIAGEEGGDLARELLMIFGYVSPDDTPIEFFQEVLSPQDEISWTLMMLYDYISTPDVPMQHTQNEIDEAGELLIKYSLVMKEEKNKVLSIHRLLQQVIRVHGQQREKETLRKILGCEGFTDLKLVPFTKYADEDLQKEFPKVKAELLDQKQLLKLLKEKRFEDALQLSRFIHKEINTNTTLFNTAICLEKNGDLEEAKTILEKLCEKEMEEESTRRNVFTLGILNLKEVLTKDLAAGYLTLLCWKMGDRKRVTEIMEIGNPVATYYSRNRLNTFLQILNSNLTSSNYSLECEGDLIRLKFKVQTKSVKIKSCYVDSGTKLPSDLQELELNGVAFKDVTGETIQSFDLREFLPLKLNKLSINYRYGVLGNLLECIVSLDGISSIEYISLEDCSLSLDSFSRISPKELALDGVKFIQNGEKQEVVKINDFIDFHKLKRMTLHGSICKMSIDFSEESLSLEYLELRNIELLNWKEGNWSVQELRLYGILFVQKTNMKIKELFMERSTLDVSCLLQDIEKLNLNSMQEVVGSGGIECPKLKYLKLIQMPSSCLSLFNSINLTHVHFIWTKDVDVNLLLESLEEVTIEKLRSAIPIVGGPRKIKKLILKSLTAKQKDEILLHLKPEDLVGEE